MSRTSASAWRCCGGSTPVRRPSPRAPAICEMTGGHTRIVSCTFAIASVQAIGIHHVADAPSGEPVRLRQRKHRDRVRFGAGKRSRRDMTSRSVREVLVHLVADVDTARDRAQSSLTSRSARSGYTAPVGLFGETVTMARVRGVMARANRRPHRADTARRSATRTGVQPGHLNRHLVVEVERHRQDDFVARLGDRQDGVHERHVAAGGHHDATAPRDVDAVVAHAASPRSRRRAPGSRSRPDTRACRGFASALARGIDGGRRRPVVDDALTERNRARHLTDEVADDLDDRRLHGVHARSGFQRVSHPGTQRRMSCFRVQ